MRDGPPLKSTRWSLWCVLWRQRKAIFYAISALSLAANAVALADSLHVRSSLARWLHLLLPHLRDLGLLLQQRCALYTLLNLIMLIVLLKSGFLSRLASSRQDQDKQMQEHVDKGRTGTSSTCSIAEPQGGHAPGECATVVPKPSSGDVMAWTRKRPSVERRGEEPMAAMLVGMAEPTNYGGNRRASLFTIEPLQEPMPTLMDPRTWQTSKLPEESPHASHRYNAGSRDDFALNRQEFNARVDGFIAKFKRNLTMQRKDSLDRLLGLAGNR